MRTLLILILVLLLLAVAFITRPGKRELALHLLDRHSTNGQWTAADVAYAQTALGEVTLKNRYLWTTVERNGKPLYTGLFGKFVPHASPPDQPVPAIADVARLASK
jgi:hypothetical protein